MEKERSRVLQMNNKNEIDLMSFFIRKNLKSKLGMKLSRKEIIAFALSFTALNIEDFIEFVKIQKEADENE